VTETLDPRWGKPSFLHDPYALAHFQPRPTDVIITTAPKSGTTWMQQILHQMRTGGDPDFGSIFEVVPWLEAPIGGKTWQERLAAFEAIPDPRVFKTHCTVEQTPGLDVAKIILTIRDPRECCVSLFHHVKGMKEGYGPPKPFDSMQACVDRFLEFGAWYRNVGGWWKERDRPNVLLLRYLDLKADLPAAVDRIAGFLGWDLDVGARARVIEYSSFAWMKSHDEQFTRMSAEGPSAFQKGAFIRRGVVGAADEDLSPAQAEQILERARATIDPECLRALGIA
jgi:hypothetical protein